MKLLEITYKYLIEFTQSILSLLKILILSKFNIQLPLINSNDDCVILANGPSLNESLKNELSIILNRKKFCVNHFVFSDRYAEIKPDYYVLAAPEFWIEKPTEWHIQMRNKVHADLIRKTDWNMILFLPHNAKRNKLWNKLELKNSNIRTVYFNNTPVEGLQSINHLLFNHNLGMPRPHNVLVPTLFLALKMGFKNVLLFGADHSWHEEIRIDEANQLTVNHEHFYDKSKQIMPMYKLDGKEYFLHDVFRKLHLAFKGYFILKEYADYLGSKILNASKKSYIDAFEKIKLSPEE
ncbi:MAG: hypothetical protein KF816_00825 [Melioribacteraceae bacterium]|jgi:hypothetical protein|nr:hypothetical protein [Melioribacteraceae bacterium]